jgi:hypothetical protein
MQRTKLLKVYSVEDSQVHLPTILKMESEVRALLNRIFGSSFKL